MRLYTASAASHPYYLFSLCVKDFDSERSQFEEFVSSYSEQSHRKDEIMKYSTLGLVVIGVGMMIMMMVGSSHAQGKIRLLKHFEYT